MRHLEVAHRHAVADVGPGGLANQRQVEPLGVGKALLLGRDEHGAVEQRHEAGDNLGLYAHAHFSSGGARSPLAVMRLSAISEILRFWFIAVLRKSA